MNIWVMTRNRRKNFIKRRELKMEMMIVALIIVGIILNTFIIEQRNKVNLNVQLFLLPMCLDI